MFCFSGKVWILTVHATCLIKFKKYCFIIIFFLKKIWRRMLGKRDFFFNVWYSFMLGIAWFVLVFYWIIWLDYIFCFSKLSSFCRRSIYRRLYGADTIYSQRYPPCAWSCIHIFILLLLFFTVWIWKCFVLYCGGPYALLKPLRC